MKHEHSCKILYKIIILYDNFAFQYEMKLRIGTLDKVVNLLRTEPDADIEDVFNVAKEEFLVRASMARP